VPLFVLGAELACAPLGVETIAVTDPGDLEAAVAVADPAAALVNPRLWWDSGLDHCSELRHRLAGSGGRLGVLTDRALPWEREQVRALGFDGYLDKPRLGVTRLTEAVGALLAGERVFPPAPPEAATPAPILGDRELAVLRLLARGWRVRAIACHLCLAERTVKSTIAGICRQLGVANTVEAVAILCELGALDPAEPAAEPVRPAAGAPLPGAPLPDARLPDARLPGPRLPELIG
jgi:DNA-binding NarL/FixJ family response regulator